MDTERRDDHYRQLELIVENAPIVLFAFDADGIFELSEGRSLESLGLEEGEVVGRSVFDVYDENEEVLALAERALDGEAFGTTVELGDRVFDVWHRPTLDEDGELVRTTGVAVDVTKRSRHEERLERLNGASRQLSTAETPTEIAHVVETIADEVLDHPVTTVWAFDEDDQCLQPLTASNCAAESGAGTEASRDEIPAGTFEMGVFADGDPVLVEDYQSLDDAGTPDSELRTTLFVPLGDHGLLTAGFSEVRDLDQSTQDLVEILARDAVAAFDRAKRERELARKNERLEEFARVISHDLRNPLNLIHGHVTLARDADDPSDHFDSIELAVDRMDQLIENLLALAREGRVVGEPMPVGLSSVASSAWSAVDTKSAELDIADEAPPVMADRERLQQLLENLFRNAVEHGGHEVTVRIGPAEAGFYVDDDGDGLDEADPDELFELGHSSTDGGTGIGLAIVKEIAEAHGWRVTATDSPDGGARFEFSDVSMP